MGITVFQVVRVALLLIPVSIFDFSICDHFINLTIGCLRRLLHSKLPYGQSKAPDLFTTRRTHIFTFQGLFLFLHSPGLSVKGAWRPTPEQA